MWWWWWQWHPGVLVRTLTRLTQCGGGWYVVRGGWWLVVVGGWCVVWWVVGWVVGGRRSVMGRWLVVGGSWLIGGWCCGGGRGGGRGGGSWCGCLPLRQGKPPFPRPKKSRRICHVKSPVARCLGSNCGPQRTSNHPLLDVWEAIVGHDVVNGPHGLPLKSFN